MTDLSSWSLPQLAQILSALEGARRNPNSKSTALKAIERNAAAIGLGAEDVLAAVLNERQIPHLFKSYYDVAYDGLFQSQKGWGAVFAPPAFRAEIVEALSSLRDNPAGPPAE